MCIRDSDMVFWKIRMRVVRRRKVVIIYDTVLVSGKCREGHAGGGIGLVDIAWHLVTARQVSYQKKRIGCT